MNKYEFTFLVEDAKALKPVEKALESFSGIKLDENAWGKRLLAYPINKITGAEFYTWHIQIETDKLEDFKKKLNYDKLVMRYLLISAEENQKTKSTSANSKVGNQKKNEEKS